MNDPTRILTRIDMHDGDRSVCWEWKGSTTGKDKRPYVHIGGRHTAVARIVFDLFRETKLKDDEIARHTCDNSLCCNPYHLIRGTHKENMQDMRERERHGLPHHAVNAIRNLASQGVLHREIAKQFGISRRNVTDIVNRKTYVDVK
jgi:hypothetical protein